MQVSGAEPRKINAHLIRDIGQAAFDQRLLTLITPPLGEAGKTLAYLYFSSAASFL